MAPCSISPNADKFYLVNEMMDIKKESDAFVHNFDKQLIMLCESGSGTYGFRSENKSELADKDHMARHKLLHKTSIPSDYIGAAIIREDVDLFDNKIRAGTICVCRPEKGGVYFNDVLDSWFHVMYYDAPTQPNGIGTRYEVYRMTRFADIRGEVLSPLEGVDIDDIGMQEFLQFCTM